MTNMRRLGHLFLHFKSSLPSSSPLPTAVDMVTRRNFESLTKAIKTYCSKDDSEEIKAGLKHALQYLIKTMASICKGTYLINNEDDKASEVDKFLEVFSLHRNILFGDAAYNLNRNRQTNLRRPEQLPAEDDVGKLKNYTVQRVQDVLRDKYQLWTQHDYSEMRDLVVSRLTLFNARRGGEPAR